MKTCYHGLVILCLIQLTSGFETGYQFVYNYHGRSSVGVNDLKLQNAVVEVHGRVIVQSVNESTLHVKLHGWHLNRNGNWLRSQFFTYRPDSTPEEIQGVEDVLPDPEMLSTPFIIIHNKGSFVSMKIESSEPVWIANFKKSIASQLQLDVTGVRSGNHGDRIPSGSNSAVVTYEDTITGDCSTMIQMNRIPEYQVPQTDAYHFPAFRSICQDHPVYEIFKTKDFNLCLNNPFFHSVTPPNYVCTLGRGQCANAMQRTSTYKYIGCGPSFENVNIINVYGFSDFIAMPFGVNTEKINTNSLTSWVLLSKEAITNALDVPTSLEEIRSLSYTYEDIENPDGTRKFPELTTPWFKSPLPPSKLTENVKNTLQVIADNLINKPDSAVDNIDRLAAVKQTLSFLSLDELSSLWTGIQDQGDVMIDLFIDAVVQSGSNPSLMLMKQLIETEQINGARAVLAVGALGFYAKTPTRQIFQQLLNLIKSPTVQSFKLLKQTAFMSVAELLNYACKSEYYKENRFSRKYLGDLCKSEESDISDELIRLLVTELNCVNASTADKMAALIAVGSLGSQDILPILEPFLKGQMPHDDPSVRIRAILSMYRVMFRHPERVTPLLIPLCENVAERPDVRMAAIGMLLTSNAPLVVWQRLASRMWIEPSAQVHAFLYDMLVSFTKYPPIYQEMITKSRMALSLIKPAPVGLPYSSSYLRSAFLTEGIATIFNTPMLRVSDETIPTVLGVRSVYQFGPFISKPFEFYAWNYNTDELWNGLFGRFFDRDSKAINELSNIWEQIKPTRRLKDKATGFIHLRLQDSIRYAFDYLQLGKKLPNLFVNFFKRPDDHLAVSFLKYHTLAEVNLRIPTEIGLPLRFLASNPLLASLQGKISGDLDSGTTHLDLASEFSWKLSTEVRVEMPWSGNYIASGVDVRAEFRLPRQSKFKFSNAMFNWTLIPSDKIVDLFYYHVKPYTITGSISDTVPVLEHEAVNMINVKEKAFEGHVSLGEYSGINLRLLYQSEMDHFDFASWFQWWQKWDPSYALVPLKLRYRQHRVRYDPAGTEAKSLEFYFHYSHHWKNNGTGTSSNSSTASVPAVDIAQRLYRETGGGKANVFIGGVKTQLTNGSFHLFQASLGIVHDDNKYFKDLRVQHSFTDSTSQVSYALCGTSSFVWNNPPEFGLSSEILTIHGDSRYTFSTTSCELPQVSVNFKSKAHRSESAARIAASTPAGRTCLEQLAHGQHDSPSCHVARETDHTYDSYELVTEFWNIPSWVAQYFKQDGFLFNNLIRPFLTKRTPNSNTLNRIVLTVQRNSLTGNSDLTIEGPSETIETRNTRLVFPVFPVLSNFWKVIYPMKASRRYTDTARSHLTAGISDAKCYVGPHSVHTFDGSLYNYTLDHCDHVLVTDSWMKFHLAVLSRQLDDRKVVTAIYEKFRFELDPRGSVTLNGAKRVLSGPFYLQDGGRLIAEIHSFADGIKLKLNQVNVIIKIRGSHVTLDAPQALRGRAIGLCGDFDQELFAEWKNAARCALPSGGLMAASFKLTDDQTCSHSSETLDMLKHSADRCISVDEKVNTYLTPFDPNKSVSCTRYEPLIFRIGETTCTSTTLSIQCSAGCKPLHSSSKYFTFRCTGGQMEDFETQFIVPKACVSY